MGIDEQIRARSERFSPQPAYEALEAVERKRQRRLLVRRVVAGGAAFGIMAIAGSFLFSAMGGLGTDRGPAAPGATPGVFVLEMDDASGDLSVLRVATDQDPGAVVATIESTSERYFPPDLAVSPDQSLIYVAHSVGDDGAELTTIDAADGQVLASTKLSGLPPLAVHVDYLQPSNDGRLVMYLSEKDDGGVETEHGVIRVFDPGSMSLLPGSVDLAGCGGAGSAYLAGDRLSVVCPAEQRVRVFELSTEGEPTSESVIALPPTTAEEISATPTSLVVATDATPDGLRLIAVTESGRIFEVDPKGTTVDEIKVGGLVGSYVGAGAAEIDSEGLLLLGVGDVDQLDGFRTSRVVAISLSTGEITRDVPLDSEAYGGFVVDGKGAIVFSSDLSQLQSQGIEDADSSDVLDVSSSSALFVDTEGV